jgi:hypothetical protein|tara:strand:- start:200 stop:304 length:105 start_codon:yes stop_codon:yes gene_type:complete
MKKLETVMYAVLTTAAGVAAGMYAYDKFVKKMEA